jgi:hypothetical protein
MTGDRCNDGRPISRPNTRPRELGRGRIKGSNIYCDLRRLPQELGRETDQCYKQQNQRHSYLYCF